MTKYEVTTKHPTGYMNGAHIFTAHQDDEGFYVTAKGFGCSRTYKTAEEAIRVICANEVCTIVKLEVVP